MCVEVHNCLNKSVYTEGILLDVTMYNIKPTHETETLLYEND